MLSLVQLTDKRTFKQYAYCETNDIVEKGGIHADTRNYYILRYWRRFWLIDGWVFRGADWWGEFFFFGGVGLRTFFFGGDFKEKIYLRRKGVFVEVIFGFLVGEFAGRGSFLIWRTRVEAVFVSGQRGFKAHNLFGIEREDFWGGVFFWGGF
jgi:hypothetical protein